MSTVLKKPAVRLTNRTGVQTKIHHLDRLENKGMILKPSELSFDKIQVTINSPKDVNISIEPKEGEYVLYHITPGFTYNDPPMGQLSILACINNKGTEQIDLDTVTIEYKKGNQTITKNLHLPSDKLHVDSNYTRCWQNVRPYHESGEVVFLEAPFPAEATFKFKFKNYTSPIVIKKKLRAYTQAFDLPFKSKDLLKDELWSGYSMHGGGDQVFAYDLGVSGYNNGWSDLLSGKDGTKNNHFRVYGKPLYAIADGYVLEVLNDCPENAAPVPGGLSKSDFEKKMTEQKDKYWGAYEDQGGGGGNHLCIRHGDVVALYAHMQKGSINSKFLKKGAAVKRGDLLGKTGNSGNSTAPHLHIHVKTYKDDATPGGKFFRPLLFNNGFVIGRDEYPSPKSNVAWTRLKKTGIPGLEGKSSFIWPDDTHPFCSYPVSWGEVSRHGIPAESYQEEFDKIWTCGYYPVWVDGYNAGTKTFFNVIFRPSAGVQWVAKHNMDGASYQSNYNKWDKEGYRLLTVNSYKYKSKINYAAVWVKDGKPQPLAYHGLTLAQHELKFKVNADKGMIPINVSCVTLGTVTYVTAIWEKKNVGGFYSRPAMTLSQYKEYFKDYTDKQKFKLVYLNAYTKGGKPMLSGIWYKNAPEYNTWWAKHYLTSSAYQTEYNLHLKNGLLTRCVTGYMDGDKLRFEGIWSK